MTKSLGSFNLLYSKKSARKIRKLDPVAKKKLNKALIKLAQDPYSNSKKLISPKLGTYRLRVGDHRLIFDIDAKNIAILKFAHRSEVYKK